MQKCYLVKEIRDDDWLPIMICAVRYEADRYAHAFGDNEDGNPKAEVVNLPFTP